MIDSVTINNAVTENAAWSGGTNFTATSISAKTTWNRYTLNVTVTNGSTSSNAGERLTIYYVALPTSGITDLTQLNGTAKSFTFNVPYAASATQYIVGPSDIASGSTLYTWFAHDAWAQPRTITLIASGTP